MPSRKNTLLATRPDAVTAHPFFGGLAKLGSPKRFAKGEVIIKEGDRDDATLYLITAGWVRVSAAEPDGKQIVIDEYGPGDFVGEMALDGQPRSASVVALEAVEAIAVSRVDALAYLREHPEFALSLMMELIRRARLATSNFKSAALKDVYSRIAELLQSMAIEVDGQRIIPGGISKAEITRRVGASRDMVSIIMRDLSVGGYLLDADAGLVITRPLPQRW